MLRNNGIITESEYKGKTLDEAKNTLRMVDFQLE